MQIINNSFVSLEELSNNLDLSGLSSENTLVQVFSSFNTEYEIRKIQSIFQEKNPGISFIGTTTAGEIDGSSVNENTILVSIVQFEHTTVKYSFFDDVGDDYMLGINIASRMIENNTKALLMFVDGLSTNGSDVMDGISSINNTVPISGGLAGDNGAFLKTYVFEKTNIYSKGCVAVSLTSEVLDVFTDYQLNWQSIGQVMTITKADKNRLYEIDGIPASDIYRKYLGDKIGDNLPFSATEFPLLKIDDDGLEVCRTFVDKFDDGSLLTIGNLEIGDKVRLAFGNVDLIINNTQKKVLQYQQHQPEVIFAYNCTARKSFLQSQITTELEPLTKIAPTCGYFTYGEFFSQNNKNALLNITLTILGIREKKKETPTSLPLLYNNLEECEKNFITNKHFLVLDALTTLSNTVIEELNQANQELEKNKVELERLASTDKLTGIYNRTRLDDLFSREISRSQRYKNSFGCAIFDIDHFKLVNDNYGHLVGDIAIKEISSLIQNNIRKLDIFGRWGGEEFLLILPEVTSIGMKNLLEKIRVIIGNCHIDKIGCQSVSIGATEYRVGDTIDSITKRADDALYEAKNKGRDNVVVY